MTKRVIVTTGLKARGYVDGRYVGEDKTENRRGDYADKKRRGKPPAGAKKRGKGRGTGAQDNIGNQIAGPKRGRRGAARTPGSGAGLEGQPPFAKGPAGAKSKNARKNRSGKKTPFRSASQPPVSTVSAYTPSEINEMRRMGGEARSGQFAEALAAQATVKRERLHKVLAQSGFGSRRDMEIMISTGRVMVNGIVAGTGTAVAPDDKVMVDQRPVVLKFSQDLPRVLLYHKPEGEIVTTDDPGNRITVFDNLPKVENGKWINIGRLDINTSGLLIFTTNGELANRFMHPRYEVEREYAVRLLGEVTPEQEARLLEGIVLDFNRPRGDEDDEPVEERFDDEAGMDDGDESSPGNVVHPAKLERIERREGEEGDGANHWYHVVIKEGRNREVRRLFEAVGLMVSRLIRTRFGNLILPPRLKRGMMQELTAEEVRKVLREHGMAELADAPDASEGRGRKPRGRPPERGPRNEAKPGPRRPQKPRPGPRDGIEPGNQAARPDGNADGPPSADGQGARDPNKKRRRNRRGRAKMGSVEQGLRAEIAASRSEEVGGAGEGGQDGGSGAGPASEGNREGAPRGPQSRRNRARRNFRNRKRRNPGAGPGGDGGGTPGAEPA